MASVKFKLIEYLFVSATMGFLLLLTSLSVVQSIDPVTLDLLTPMRDLGEACGYEGCPLTKEGMLNVHIIPHTHAEIGHTRTFDDHYTGHDNIYDTSNINMKRILDYTISELWSWDKRKFTLADMPHFFHWWANRDETVRRMVYQLIRQGRLHLVGGGWGMVDEACTSYHGIIDQYSYSLRKLNATFWHCGRPLVAWQSDVFGHSREFASLSAQMGFDALFLSPISYEDELRRMRTKELEMLWRGSDDLGPVSDIFTHKLFDGYWSPPGFCFGGLCTDPLIVFSDENFNNVAERVEKFIDNIKNRQGPSYASSHVMVIMGKRFGYHDAPRWFRNIDKLIQSVNEKSYSLGANVSLMYSAPACYLKAIHESNLALPIKQDDFMPVTYDKYSHFTGLFTSRPTIKYMVREGHVYLQMIKQMQVLARIPYNAKIFEEMNWIMGKHVHFTYEHANWTYSNIGIGVMQDHNVITGAMRAHVKNYYTHKMYCAVQKCSIILKEAFNKVRRSPADTMYYRCAFNISSCRNTNSDRSFVLIHNPLAWPVTVPVRIPISHNRYVVHKPNMEPVTAVVIKMPEVVVNIPYRDTIADHEIVFIAEDLPPMGYRSYYIERNLRHRKRRDVTPNKRSIIKKLNKNKNKKYLTRQTNTMRIDEKSLLDTQDYDYYEDITLAPTLANVSAGLDNEYMESPIVSPTTRKPVKQDSEAETQSSESKDYGTTYIEEPETKVTTEKIADQTFYDFSKYGYRATNDKYIGNKYITVTLDSSNQVSSVKLSNGVQIVLNINVYYYASDDPVKFEREEKNPGAYIFKTMDPIPVLIKKNFKSSVYKTSLVEEVHYKYDSWCGFSVKVYKDRPVIEIDWVVGPIPTDDNIGKDVFIRYSTDLNNGGVFATDSNGRQTVKRILNDRPTYEAVNPGIPGNFYPVTSKIYIEDENKNVRFSVFNDRAQGGTSLNDGQVDLMVHRRILTDDDGIQAFLNDTEHGKGIVVRGKHYLYISKADYKPNKIFEKKFAKEIELAPQLFASKDDAYENFKKVWSEHINEYAGINTKLPLGIHVLTLESWNDNCLLVRLENYLEKADVVKSGIKTVFLRDLFTNITIIDARETTLGANIWLKDWAPLQWNAKMRFLKSFNEFYTGNGSVEYSDDHFKGYEEVDIEKGVELSPQQIRTFVVGFKYHDN